MPPGWEAPRHRLTHAQRSPPTFSPGGPIAPWGPGRPWQGERERERLAISRPRTPPRHPPIIPQPRPRPPPGRRPCRAALSGHSDPGFCPPAPAAHEPAPLTHLGTWVALLPRGAGLSLGTLWRQKQALKGASELSSPGGKPDRGPQLVRARVRPARRDTRRSHQEKASIQVTHFYHGRPTRRVSVGAVTAPARNQLGRGMRPPWPCVPRARDGVGPRPVLSCRRPAPPTPAPLSGWPESPSRALRGCYCSEAVVGAGPPDLPRCLSGLVDHPFLSHPGWH